MFVTSSTITRRAEKCGQTAVSMAVQDGDGVQGVSTTFSLYLHRTQMFHKSGFSVIYVYSYQRTYKLWSQTAGRERGSPFMQSCTIELYVNPSQLGSYPQNHHQHINNRITLEYDFQ